jgi:protein-S-isoprenylcysteine O-methyltransferase Ste14
MKDDEMSPSSLNARERRLLDLLEKSLALVFFVWLCVRFGAALEAKPQNFILLISEGIIVAMLIFRRATDQISIRISDWVAGVAGTLLPMLISPAPGGTSMGAALMVLGLILSVGAKLSLRRSFGVVAANRGIKRSGLYAAVRHPMYLGHVLTYAGAFGLNPSWGNAGILCVWAVFQIVRIHAEERILMQDPDYQAHAQIVRYRLVPFIY